MDAFHGTAGCTLSSCLSRALPAFLCSIFSILGTEPKASNPLGVAPLSLSLGPLAYPIPQLTHHALQPRGTATPPPDHRTHPPIANASKSQTELS